MIWATAIAVDSAGNAYVTGYTSSAEATFPVTVGPDLTYNGSSDAFVAKVNAAGTALVYGGYIGGSGDESATASPWTVSGNAYVTGYTDSTQATFPVTVGPDLTYNGGDMTPSWRRSTPRAPALVYCGYIGGGMTMTGYGIAVDGAGNAYVTGYTDSTESHLPGDGRAGPDLQRRRRRTPSWPRSTPPAPALVYCGYIGGVDDDVGYGIAVDGSGNAYVTGTPTPPRPRFPVTVGPDLTYNGGRRTPSWPRSTPRARRWSTAATSAAATTMRATASPWTVRATPMSRATPYSTEATFPVTVGPDLTYNGGGRRLRGQGQRRRHARSSTAATSAAAATTSGTGIAVDGAGNAYVTGDTDSTEATFPVTVGPDLTYNGGGDAFVAKVNAAGHRRSSTAATSAAPATTTATASRWTVRATPMSTGYTASTQATFPVTVGPDLTYNGGIYDAFVAKVMLFRAARKQARDGRLRRRQLGRGRHGLRLVRSLDVGQQRVDADRHE